MEGSGARGAAPPKEASSPQETYCPEPAKQGPGGEPKPSVPVALAYMSSGSSGLGPPA